MKKLRKILSIVTLAVPAAILVTFIVIFAFNISRYPIREAKGWIALSFFLLSYIAGLVLLILARKKEGIHHFHVISRGLFFFGSIFIIVYNNSAIHAVLFSGIRLEYLHTILLTFAVLNLIGSLALFLITVCLFPPVKTILGNLVRPNAPAVKEAEPEEEIEETPVQKPSEEPVAPIEEDLTVMRLAEAKAMFDKKLIDEEDFKKIKAHILASDL